MLKKLFAIFILIFGTIRFGLAQGEIEMADVMRSNGKIYVVVAVAAIVLLGMIGYLISIDRKLSRIEKEIESKTKN